MHLWLNGDRKKCFERQITKNILAGAETGLDVASTENVFSEKAWQLHCNPQRKNVPGAVVLDVEHLGEEQLLDAALRSTATKILQTSRNLNASSRNLKQSRQPSSKPFR